MYLQSPNEAQLYFADTKIRQHGLDKGPDVCGCSNTAIYPCTGIKLHTHRSSMVILFAQ